MQTFAFSILFLLLSSVSNAAYSQQKNLENFIFSHPAFNSLLEKQYQVKKTLSREFQIFYDTPDLQLLHQGDYLLFNAKEKGKDKQKFKRTVAYKHQTMTHFAVKNYQQIKTVLDKHPLFFLIKRDVRPQFVQQLNNDGIKEVTRLKDVFSHAKNTTAIQIFFNGQKLLTFYQLEHTVQIVNFDFDFSSYHYQLESLAQHNPQLDALMSDVIENFDILPLSKIPENEYQMLFNHLKSKLNVIEYLIQYKILSQVIFVIMLCLLGLLIIKLLFYQRIKT